MPLEEPSWWYAREPRVIAKMLSPLGSIYSWAVRRRCARTRSYHSWLPVICVGNFTAGGTGKTPTAIHIGNLLASLGQSPVFLTRGHGGSEKGPHWVSPDSDGPGVVGDEPLLLARHYPTMIARDRAQGARAIEAGVGDAGGAVAGRTGDTGHVGHVRATCIVMDDGLQNPLLAKDLSFAVVDGKRGIGNGRVIPAGPLRAKLAFQLAMTDAVIVNRPGSAVARNPDQADQNGPDIATWMREKFPGPVLDAHTRPAGDTSWLKQTDVLAFAGIGAPERFFSALTALGANVVATRPFPDHHYYSQTDADNLLRLALESSAVLVTTEKDLVRLQDGSKALDQLKESIRVLPVASEFSQSEEKRLVALLEGALAMKQGNARR